jgi:hypothetical protein
MAERANPDDEIDALFQLPLADFTSARNALAARLRKAGQPAAAAQVKAIPKPSVPAWVANQIYWRHRDALERLIDATRRFRHAQAAQLAGRRAELRETLEAQRKALTEVTSLATAAIRQAEASPTPDLLRRVSATLDALSAAGPGTGAPRAGRLTNDLQPAGFETLAALVPHAGSPPSRNGPSRVLSFSSGSAGKRSAPDASAGGSKAADDQRTRAAAARAAVRDAERALAEAQRQARTAETQLRAAAAAASEAEGRKAEAARQMERAAASADEARQHARRVAAAAEEAADRVADAERVLEAARQNLDRVR